MQIKFIIPILVLLLSACFSNSVPSHIPKDSKFFQIKTGMTQEEVEKILGHPTDAKESTTGNEWIPFYDELKSDVLLCTYFYKGQGNIVFTNENNVHVILSISQDYSTLLYVREINYDPTASGYADNN